MRNLAYLAAFAFTLSAPITAFALEETVGIVTSVNPASGMLMLQSGQWYDFPNGNLLLGFLPGDEVGVTHDGTTGIGAFDPEPANKAN